MVKFDIEKFKGHIFHCKMDMGVNSLRKIAEEVGVSAATLSRVQRGKMPDLESFGKICKWMEGDMNDYFYQSIDEE